MKVPGPLRSLPGAASVPSAEQLEAKWYLVSLIQRTKLTRNERRVLSYVYCEFTYREIGDLLYLSRTRIGQIYSKAKRKLRQTESRINEDS